MKSWKLPVGFDDQRVIVGLLRLADVVIVAVSGIVTYWLRHGFIAVPEQYLVGIALAALLTANYFQLAHLYSFAAVQRLAARFGALTASWSAVMLTLVLIAYFGKVSEIFSRVWVVSWFAVSFFAFLLLRGFLAWLLDRWADQGRLTFNVAVIGADQLGARLIRHLEAQKKAGTRLVGVFDDRKTRIPETVAGHKVRGTVDDLLAFARRNRVDAVAVVLPWSAEQRLMEIRNKLRTLAVDVKLCPETVAFDLPNLGYGDLAGVPMLTLVKPPLTGWNVVAKAVEDQVLTVLLLLVLWPLMLAIAGAVKLTSRGPVLFRQTRYGFNNNEITVFKFRTMYWRPEGEAEVVQARRNDPRVTPVGRLLRRTSLDELPQLFNVLRGEMSLVGPRPHAVAHNVRYAAIIDEYFGRHRVKPGITGWAQVNGLRGETETPELMRRRVQYDLYYIEHWSLLFDLKILVLTLFVGFVHDRAY